MVTPIYAAVLALMFVVLSARVIAFQRNARVGLGDGGNRGLLRRIRAHRNFAEYVPFSLVLMALAEAQNCPSWTIHALGSALVIGRVLHAIGVTTEPETAGFRVAGMGRRSQC